MLYVGDNTGQLLSLDSRQGKALVNAVESAHDKYVVQLIVISLGTFVSSLKQMFCLSKSQAN